jgi:hypothetical protein
MISNRQRTISLSTVAIAAVITLFTTGPLVATHQAQARGFGDQNPTTGNPHPTDPTTGIEGGNPHDTPSCNGNPHG